MMELGVKYVIYSDENGIIQKEKMEDYQPIQYTNGTYSIMKDYEENKQSFHSCSYYR